MHESTQQENNSQELEVVQTIYASDMLHVFVYKNNKKVHNILPWMMSPIRFLNVPIYISF